jgi:Fe-S cluster biogenesis protein NfuA|tara:strand:- start:735 stop:968 length:234 start_codon:yes stop_codon:yes gene_type:complete
MTKEIEEKVLIALDEIRPFLEKDGGDISLDSISDNKIVNVKLHGTCVGCKVNQMTLKLGVETIIKRHVPHIEEVNSV